MFLDNAPVHPENLVGKYSNIKIVFLRKNTTSRLQPLYAGIFRNFKVKYRKTLLRHVIARISNDRSASDIAKEVDILQAITWVATAWNKVLETTIKNCFYKVWHCATSSSKWRIWVGCRVCWTLQRAHRDKRSWKRFHSWGTYWFWYWNFNFHLPITSEMVDWKAASFQEVIFLASFFFIKLVDIYFCIWNF